MKPRLVRFLLAFAALSAMGIHGVCEDTLRPSKALPRFREVAPGLYRGGQPTPEGFDLLKQRGVKTVINLREEKDERAVVEGLGMKYVYIPLDARDEVSGEVIKSFLATVTDPASQPVFVHCRRGADRTGFMIGVYRIARQGWSARQAYSEAREIGMRWWFRGLKRQLYGFAEEIAASKRTPAGD